MADDSRDRVSAALLAARRAMAVAMTAALLASCSSGEQEAQPDRSAWTSPSAAPRESGGRTQPPAPTPSADAGDVQPPSVGDAAMFAGQLDHAVATLRKRDATADEVQQAGELQQLAIRALARASDRFRRTVLARLRPATARETRSELRAAELLTAITEPKPKFPPWRIVTPPPVPVLLGYYREAQRLSGVPWTYLAAIHLVETRMGRIRGPSTAGALGPMQFLPSTWARFGGGGDVNDAHDAILAAARLLRAYGAPADMAGALRHYNPSDRYVGAVTEYARTMQRSSAAYRGYWHWRVLYHHVRGTYVLPDGYPDVRPVLLPGG